MSPEDVPPSGPVRAPAISEPVLPPIEAGQAQLRVSQVFDALVKAVLAAEAVADALARALDASTGEP